MVNAHKNLQHRAWEGSRVLGECCKSVTRLAAKCGWLRGTVMSRYESGAVMRVIVILAVLLAPMVLGGCFFHHNQAVVAQPLPPLK